MKISVTINIGNYENMKLDTNEHEDWDKCVKELMYMLGDIPNREVKRFYERLVDQDLLTKEHPLVKKWKEIAGLQPKSETKKQDRKESIKEELGEYKGHPPAKKQD